MNNPAHFTALTSRKKLFLVFYCRCGGRLGPLAV